MASVGSLLWTGVKCGMENKVMVRFGIKAQKYKNYPKK